MQDLNIRLARRLTLTIGGGFALALGLLLAISLVGMDEIHHMNEQLERIVQQNNAKTRLATQMRDILRDRTITMHSIIVMSDEFEKEDEMRRFYRFGEDYFHTRTQLGEMLSGPDELATLERIDTLTRMNQPIMVELVDLGMQGYTFLAFETLQTEAIPIQRQLVRELDTMVAIQREATAAAAAEAANAYKKTRLLLITLGLAAAMVIGVVALVVIRRTTRQAATIERERVKYQTLFETNTDGIVILDQGGFIDCNPATLQMFGLEDANAFRRLDPAQLGAALQPHGETAQDTAQQRIREAIETGHATFDWTGRRADGSEFPAHIGLHAIRLDGQPYIQAIIRDVTDQRAAEDALKAAHDAALSTARMKSQFVANVSHEIRTPMNGILGMVQLLLATKLDTQQHDYADAMLRSAKSLLRIINEILDFSKLEAGQLMIESIEFELPELLQEAVALYAPRAREKGLAFELRTDDLPLWVRGDPLRLRQILLNLLDNALKFTERGEVSLMAQHLGSVDGLDWYRFTVNDTGIGIAAEDQDRIFHAFAQADGSTTRKYGGTGLGLSICAQLAELMGGCISIESEAGAGSRFHLDIPLELASAPALPIRAESKPPAAIPHFEGLRVLLAEDNPINQKLVRYMLEGLGVEVEVADNGRLAFEALQKAPPDLVFMDCQMPDWDGTTASRAIRTWETETGRNRLPIVALTANAMDGYEEICRAAGMDDYLTKPVQAEDLARVLGHWLPDKVVGAGLQVDGGPTAPTVTMLDLERLHQLCRNDPARIQEMLDVFLTSSATSLQALDRVCAERDTNLAAREAHQFKGACAFMGAETLRQAAAQLEQAAKAADWPTAEARLADLHVGYDTARREIEALTP